MELDELPELHTRLLLVDVDEDVIAAAGAAVSPHLHSALDSEQQPPSVGQPHHHPTTRLTLSTCIPQPGHSHASCTSTSVTSLSQPLVTIASQLGHQPW